MQELITHKCKAFLAWKTITIHKNKKQSYKYLKTKIQQKITDLKNRRWRQKSQEIQKSINNKNIHEFVNWQDHLQPKHSGVHPAESQNSKNGREIINDDEVVEADWN